MKDYEKIKSLMDEKGVKQIDIVKATDTHRSSVSAWLKGDRGIPKNKIEAIAKLLGTSSDYLLGNDNKKPVAFVPVTGTASCGTSEIDFNQEENRTCYYNGEFWHEDLYCVIADGDSMAPEFESGDEIIIDPRREPQHGDVVHYQVMGESALKVLFIDEEAHLIQLIPFNASDDFKTRTIRMDAEECQELKMYPVVAINKLRFKNRAARLRMIGR